MKVYVAGPMTGIPDHNFPAFRRAAELLREQGHEVVNPAELDDPTLTHEQLAAKPWADYMRRDIPLLLECDAIFMLPGWSNSKGASLELHIAQQLGMEVVHLKHELR